MHDSNDVVCSKDLEQLRGQFGAALSATVKAGEVLARVNRDLHQQEDER